MASRGRPPKKERNPYTHLEPPPQGRLEESSKDVEVRPSTPTSTPTSDQIMALQPIVLSSTKGLPSLEEIKINTVPLVKNAPITINDVNTIISTLPELPSKPDFQPVDSHSNGQSNGFHGTSKSVSKGRTQSEKSKDVTKDVTKDKPIDKVKDKSMDKSSNHSLPENTSSKSESFPANPLAKPPEYPPIEKPLIQKRPPGRPPGSKNPTKSIFRPVESSNNLSALSSNVETKILKEPLFDDEVYRKMEMNAKLVDDTKERMVRPKSPRDTQPIIINGKEVPRENIPPLSSYIVEEPTPVVMFTPQNVPQPINRIIETSTETVTQVTQNLLEVNPSISSGGLSNEYLSNNIDQIPRPNRVRLPKTPPLDRSFDNPPGSPGSPGKKISIEPEKSKARNESIVVPLPPVDTRIYEKKSIPEPVKIEKPLIEGLPAFTPLVPPIPTVTMPSPSVTSQVQPIPEIQPVILPPSNPLPPTLPIPSPLVNLPALPNPLPNHLPSVTPITQVESSISKPPPEPQPVVQPISQPETKPVTNPEHIVTEKTVTQISNVTTNKPSESVFSPISQPVPRSNGTHPLTPRPNREQHSIYNKVDIDDEIKETPSVVDRSTTNKPLNRPPEKQPSNHVPDRSKNDDSRKIQEDRRNEVSDDERNRDHRRMRNSENHVMNDRNGMHERDRMDERDRPSNYKQSNVEHKRNGYPSRADLDLSYDDEVSFDSRNTRSHNREYRRTEEPIRRTFDNDREYQSRMEDQYRDDLDQMYEYGRRGLPKIPSNVGKRSMRYRDPDEYQEPSPYPHSVYYYPTTGKRTQYMSPRLQEPPSRQPFRKPPQEYHHQGPKTYRPNGSNGNEADGGNNPSGPPNPPPRPSNRPKVNVNENKARSYMKAHEKVDKWLRNLEIPDYESMTDEVKTICRKDLLCKFAVMRAAYEKFVIPLPPESISVRELYLEYNRWLYYAKITNSISYYKLFLLIFWYGIEFVGTKYLGLKLTSYTRIQLQNMYQYENSLYEMSEQGGLGVTEGWSPLAKLLFTSCVQCVIIVLISTFAHWCGGPQMIETIHNMVNKVLAPGPISIPNEQQRTSTSDGSVLGAEAPPRPNEAYVNGLTSLFSGLGEMFGGGGKPEPTTQSKTNPFTMKRPPYSE